jgi:hypothetical protein
MKSIILKIITFILICLCFSSCGNGDDSKILQEFSKLSPKTQEFFNANAKVQCSCLKEHQGMLEKMIKDSRDLVNDLKSKKINNQDEIIQKRIQTQIYPILSKYNDCNAEAPQPNPETFRIIENDLKTFSGASVPGGASDNKMRNLGNALLLKHCNEYHKLSVELTELTIVISPGYSN